MDVDPRVSRPRMTGAWGREREVIYSFYGTSPSKVMELDAGCPSGMTGEGGAGNEIATSSAQADSSQ